MKNALIYLEIHSSLILNCFYLEIPPKTTQMDPSRI